ncbi:MAG: hypothetical protein WBA76_18400 [Phormidesmis sp.]
MIYFDMPRKRKNLSLDEVVIDGIEHICSISKEKPSFSFYVERLLAAHLIANNVVPPSYTPPGETRGGNRTQSGTEDSGND